jgi:hypothetical protein
MSLTVSHFNPNFEEWEDTELATREDVLAAVREWEGVEEIDSVSFAGVVGPDWEFSTSKPGRYLILRLDDPIEEG